MSVLFRLISRNTKVFFKDKGSFFASLISPLIILFLFITFLGDIYRDSFTSMIPDGIEISSTISEGFAGGWLMSSLLAVCCVTVAFTANMTMVQDKVTGAISDFKVAPIKGYMLGLGYYISTALVTAIICYATTAVGFVYLYFVGWYLSVADVFCIISDVLLMTMFGTALSSVVCFFLDSLGGVSAVCTLVSAIYGFVCGAYMPISQFSPVIQKIISFLPGTYGTGLFRQHFMKGVLSELGANYFPAEAIEQIGDGFDVNMYFFGNKVETPVMYAVLGGAILLFVFIYLFLNAIKQKNK